MHACMSVGIFAQMASGPPRKRRKTDAEALVELHRGSYVSQTALSQVLAYVRDNGIPDATSRFSQYKANETLVAQERNEYGNVLSAIDMPVGDGRRTFENWVCNPGPFLYSVCKKSKPFRALLRRQLHEHPCSLSRPWHIILYFDGISPRDPLAKGKDYRGCDAVYWSFIEFDEFLGDEDLWFTVSTARQAKIKAMPGGIGQAIGMILKGGFFSSAAGGFNFETTGVTLDVSELGDASAHATIVAKLSCVIGDEEALRELHMNKGHAGTKPCAICRNVLNRKYNYTPWDTSGTYVDDACLEKCKLVSNTDANIVALLERLRPDWERYQRDEITAGQYTSITQIKGWNFHPTHLAVDPFLRYLVMSYLCFDWMHIYFVGGIVDREIRALLEHKVFKHMCDADDLHEYFMKWTWPHKHHSAATVWETGDFQASASQELSAIPVLARYVRQVIAKMPSCDVVADQIASVLALCDAVDVIIRAARRLPCTHAEIDSAVLKHLRLHQRAYGCKYWVYKHHMSIHLGDMFEKHGALSCFVQERKHKHVKRFAKDHLCKKRPEKALMIQMTAQHAHDLKDLTISHGLESATAATKKLMEALQQLRPGTHSAVSSIVAHSQFGQIKRGDIVLMGADRDHVAVQVWFHVCCDNDESQSLVQILTTKHACAVDGVSRHAIEEDRDPVLVPLRTLKSPVTYRRINDEVTCLWPVEYRTLCC